MERLIFKLVKIINLLTLRYSADMTMYLDCDLVVTDVMTGECFKIYIEKME